MSAPLTAAELALAGTPPPLAPEALRDIVAGLASAEPLWRAIGRPDPEARRAVRLLATDAYEVWVLTWSPGQGVELHDHGPSAGALVVVDGELDEVVCAGGALDTAALARGVPRDLPVGIVHGVANIAGRPAISIHAYSPPLSTMGRWDPLTLEPLGADAVVVEEPALPSSAAAALLHPSARRSGGA